VRSADEIVGLERTDVQAAARRRNCWEK